MSVRTTVICAVWHQDPRRHQLLAGHGKNLDGQTVAVDRVYVYDNGDEPPKGLAGSAVTATAPLTIYEAWNVALSLVRTPYVMNLNLDDRLAPDAVALLERELDAGADLAGGDWRLCFSQDETDAVQPCCPAEELPSASEWPPAVAQGTRLGSMDVDTDTFGPACIWRLSLHAEFSRYPWKLDDGTKILIAGDWLWWNALAGSGKTLVRCPIIIGNYHSHPSEQAEFRHPRDDLDRGYSRATWP